MMTYVLCALYFLSTVSAIVTGKTVQAGQAFLDGAQAAFNFSLSIAGPICLWSGICELMERCGAAAALSRFLQPALRRLFPRSTECEEITEALTENVSANILGLGNAATPAGIRAAKAISAMGQRDELCLLVLLNTASIQLIPSTIAAVRQAEGAAAAFDIIPAVWFASVASLTAGLLAAGLLRRIWP